MKFHVLLEGVCAARPDGSEDMTREDVPSLSPDYPTAVRILEAMDLLEKHNAIETGFSIHAGGPSITIKPIRSQI